MHEKEIPDFQDCMLQSHEARIQELAEQQRTAFEEECLIREELLDEARLEWETYYRPPVPDYPEGEEPF